MEQIVYPQADAFDQFIGWVIAKILMANTGVGEIKY